MKNKFFGNKHMALSQIFLMVISVVAFAYIIGSETGIVSAAVYIPSDISPRSVLYGLQSQQAAENSPSVTGTPASSAAVTGGAPAAGSSIAFSATGQQLFPGHAICPSCNYKLGEDGIWHKYSSSGTEIPIDPNSMQTTQLNKAYCETNPSYCETYISSQPTIVSPNGATEINDVVPGTDLSSNRFLEKPIKQQVAPIIPSPTTLVSLNGKEGFLKLNDDKLTYKLVDENGKTIPGQESISAKDAAGATPTLNTATFGSAILQNLLYAVAISGGIQLFGGVLGLDKTVTQPLSNAAGVGYFVGSSLNAVSANGGTQFFANTAGGARYGTWIGVGVGAYLFLRDYRESGTVEASFTCSPWQAPTGGQSCETCNKGILPCSEYQCKSLGQPCELVNKGTTDEKCVWVNKNDVTPPIIKALDSALLNINYKYNPDNAILPPDRGVTIDYSLSPEKCVPAFTPLRLGVALNEPAKCKVDVLRKNKFEEMTTFMDNGLLEYNHTFSLSLPSPNITTKDGIGIENGGDYNLFVRCEDANKNANIGTFVFKYCVDKGPDTTPPLIVATSVPNNMPISFNQSQLNLQVYVNEPAECKWSHNNRDYSSMENSMTCETGVGNANAQGLYTCAATLTGMKDRVENKFYFRCKDKPFAADNDRNVNAESYEYAVIGTQPLVINSAIPNGTTIKDATAAVKVTFGVKTSAGFSDGKANCFYSNTGQDSDYVQFFDTGKNSHKQDLFLPAGNYTYFIRCIDLGGNKDDKQISFGVESDHSPPAVVRAYHEETFLKLITNEEAKCVYDIVDCNYQISDGTPLTDVDGKNHFTSWDIKSNLYVKCQDKYGNQPLPNECSIVVKNTAI